MRGTVKKEGSTWYYRVYVGVDPITLKKKYKRKRGFKTKKEADSALAKVINEITEGTLLDNDTMTVKQYLAYFNNQYVKKNCAPSTVKRYSFSINNINEYLGNIKLIKLNPLMIQQFYDDVIFDKEQSQNTLLKTHRTLHLALQCALKWRLVNTNACDLVVKPKSTKTQIEFWPSDKVKYYLKEIESDFLYGPTFFACHTGLRVGEICALQWKDIDLTNSLMTITKNRSRDIDNTLVDSTTKNKKERTITLFQSTVDYLITIQPDDISSKIINFDKSNFKDERYVFTYKDGRPLDPHYISQNFTELIKGKENIKHKITFHGTRHTHATMLLAAGVNIKIISERLGHATVAFTMDTYVHVDEDLQRKEMQKASNFF